MNYAKDFMQFGTEYEEHIVIACGPFIKFDSTESEIADLMNMLLMGGEMG